MMSEVWDLANLEPSEKLVFLSLADNANDGGVCWPSIANMVRKTGLSESTVQRVIGRLVDRGLLRRQERPGRSTVYTLHPLHGDTPVMVTPPSPRHPTPVTMTPHPPHGDTQNHHRTINEPSFVPDTPLAVDATPKKRVGQKQKESLPFTDLPDQWRQFVEGTLADADSDEMFCDFRDHHLKVGSRFLDWGAAWRTWVRNAVKGMNYVRRARLERVENNEPIISAAEWAKRRAEKAKVG
jgi:hypothetical protein